jgi:peroxiredoxin family protein
MEVSLFFTFWGLERLKKGGLDKGPLSKMNFFGLGKWMIKRKMKASNVQPLPDMLADYVELGGQIWACDMTMDIMGISASELREDIISNYCAVGTYIDWAKDSALTLFI